MKKLTLSFLLAALALGPAFAADGETLYAQYCQACHQAGGEGIPGTYPFIGGPIKNLSGFEEGREFVIATTLFGLKGEMVQRGYTYDGFMPGYGAVMSDEEVATLLNWIARQTTWQRAEGASTAAYTAEEVARVRTLALDPEQVHALLAKVEEIMHATRAPGPKNP